jgi:hypothetical protein
MLHFFLEEGKKGGGLQWKKLKIFLFNLILVKIKVQPKKKIEDRMT